MTKLEQMQERARELRPKLLPTKDEMDIYERKMLSLITEVWNETIKECEGCVPEEVKGNDDEYDHYDTGLVVGHNRCRKQTLQAMRQMYETTN